MNSIFFFSMIALVGYLWGIIVLYEFLKFLVYFFEECHWYPQRDLTESI